MSELFAFALVVLGIGAIGVVIGMLVAPRLVRLGEGEDEEPGNGDDAAGDGDDPARD